MSNDTSVNLNRRRDFSTYEQRPQESAKETTENSIFNKKEPNGTIMRALDLLGEHYKENRKQVDEMDKAQKEAPMKDTSELLGEHYKMVRKLVAKIDSLAKTLIEPSEQQHYIK